MLSNAPQIISNINQTGAGSDPSSFTKVGALTFFVANDGIHGEELWKTNGTPSGTAMVKDIDPGPGSSSPAGLTALGDELLFFADDGVHGEELWKSDGTTAGTVLVKDINPGSSSSISGNGTAVLDGKVYFAADDGVDGDELWSSDGTTAGTTMVSNINTTPGTSPNTNNGSNPSDFTVFQGALYFAANDGPDNDQLWKSDGTAAGTTLVSIINPTGGAYPSNLTPVGSTLFFSAYNGSDPGDQLWKSDGTTAGTSEVTTIPPAPFSLDFSNVQDLAAFDGEVYFDAADEIWKSDGTVAGTVAVSTTIHNILGNLTPIDGRLAFVTLGEDFERQLYSTDGTAAGTTLVKPIDVTPPGGFELFSENQPMATLGDELYFAASSTSTGTEFWETDGTAAGTRLVRDINPFDGSAPQYGGSNPTDITAVGGRLYFAADDPIEGDELWTSLGTPLTTYMVKNIDTGSAGSSPSQFVGIGSETYFSADDGIHGQELFKTDGTSSGTTLVKDIDPGPASSRPESLFNDDGKLLFSANDGTDGDELWISNGTASGTALLKDINPGSSPYYGPNSSYPTGFTLLNGEVIFSANDGVDGDELWETNGTAAGTTLLKDINPGTHYSYFPTPGQVPNNSYPSNFTLFQGKLYFSANDGIDGTELWETDGTASGTTLVKDIRPGTYTGFYGGTYGYGSNPSHLTVVGGHLFFTANDGVDGTELWETDGTAAGTVLVKDINPGSAGSYPSNLTAVGGELFFNADDGTHGRELWKSNGTAAGTVLVKDINPGSAGSATAYDATFIAFDGQLFFTADDGTHGMELWRSDGTAAGTTLVKDIDPGPTGGLQLTAYGRDAYTGPAFAVVGRTLYFVADDGTHGRELWETDGTSLGTKLVEDINPGPADAFPVYGEVLDPVNGSLDFAADDGVDGYEPWTIPSNRPGSPAGPSLSPEQAAPILVLAPPPASRSPVRTLTSIVPLGPILAPRSRPPQEMSPSSNARWPYSASLTESTWPLLISPRPHRAAAVSAT